MQPPADDSFLTEQYQRFHGSLLTLAERYFNPMLRSRCSPEDIVQDTYAAAMKRVGYFREHPEVPMYCKWRTLLFQALGAAERRHLQSKKRDAFCELNLTGALGSESSPGSYFDRLAASVTSPQSKVAKMEEAELLMRELNALPPDECSVLTLRQLDGYSAAECTELLDMTDKSFNTCYIRALRHLRKRLKDLPEFRL